MADLLNLLVHYHLTNSEINEEGNQLFFGDLSWPKNAKTNFVVAGSDRPGQVKEYYSIESVLFYLENLHSNRYDEKAVAAKVPTIRNVDRKDLKSYLFGEIVTCPSIDENFPLQLPLQCNVEEEKRDPLCMLRHFNIHKLEIIEKENRIIFDDVAWPRNVKTNCVVGGSEKGGRAKVYEYYTLESLLYFLNNKHLAHPVYAKQAIVDNIAVVPKSFREELLSYLNGETTSCAFIDHDAPLENPDQCKVKGEKRDPLHLLRHFNIHEMEIIEKENQIIFGDVAFPKNVKTNYIVGGSLKGGGPKEYYTLESLLYFLKNKHLVHPVYIKQATADNVEAVRRPFRIDLLAYLSGQVTSSKFVEHDVPLDIPYQSNVKEEKRHPLDLLRHFNMHKMEIIERDDRIIFEDVDWPKNVKIKCIVGFEKDSDGTLKKKERIKGKKEYYTLECLLYFLKNKHLDHNVYVRKAAANNVAAVPRPFRKDLLEYLNGEVTSCGFIDHDVPVDMPHQVKQGQRRKIKIVNNLTYAELHYDSERLISLARYNCQLVDDDGCRCMIRGTRKWQVRVCEQVLSCFDCVRISNSTNKNVMNS